MFVLRKTAGALVDQSIQSPGIMPDIELFKPKRLG